MSAIGAGRPSGPVDAARLVAVKVPRITLLFWLVKLLTTGMGEAAWDWMDHSLGQRLALVLSGGALVAALVAQFAARRYNTWLYWAAVVMVSVFGTAVADVMHNEFGVPYTVSTAVLLVAVAAVFALWYAVEKTLSIHSVRSGRREVFYWTAVLLTFALGTAAGDWTADTLSLGYFPSGLLFLVAFLLPAAAHRWLGMNAILAFWLSYIVTRPLGASFADFFAGPDWRGGLSMGFPVITVVLTAMIVAALVHLARTGRDQPLEAADGPGAPAAPR
jgi:uncharacterized membrane-anchored protein